MDNARRRHRRHYGHYASRPLFNPPLLPVGNGHVWTVSSMVGFCPAASAVILLSVSLVKESGTAFPVMIAGVVLLWLLTLLCV
ncbi:hypothetical protein V8F06_000539 [Rhypophila decipiens]